MAREDDHDEPASAGVMLPSLPATEGGGEDREDPPSAVVRPHLRVRLLERTALIRFEGAELLLDEAIVRELDQQLDRLIRSHGRSRLVLNFDGVRYLSSDVLGKLARLAKEAEPAHGRVRLCGLDPLLRVVLRITHLDGMFDVCSDEAEALGLIVP
jgi:anti-sigma B factor antagonist